MNAIVMNTLTGAVSEYTTFAGFQSITPAFAGSATGMFSLGGDTDDGVPIKARFQTGLNAWKSGMKKMVDTCYFSISGTGACSMFVGDDSTTWEYSFAANGTGKARCKPGRGIRSNNLSFGMSNTDGQAFTLDFIEVQINDSNLRRT
jgi:hypothetical protein